MNLVTSKDGTSIAYEREVRGPAVVLVALPGAGAPARTGELADVGRARDATAAQVALAWLLQRSPVMLPIPVRRGSPISRGTCAPPTSDCRMRSSDGSDGYDSGAQARPRPGVGFDA
jgi:hypothetical protein